MSGTRRILETDVLVVGSGLAGLVTALAAAPRRVVVATKGRLRSGSTPCAQGGIAAAIGRGDAPARHAGDTLTAGRGLSEPAAVSVVTEGAPGAVARLESLGVRFDRDASGVLSLGLEGGHGRKRILHAGGDKSGAAIAEALVERVRSANHVRVEEGLFVVDLLSDGERVDGAVARGPSGEDVLVLAPRVVLATGGLGQVYRFTTNPPEVTGDGIAMAARAGAVLADLEFVQFHPTALDAGPDAAPRPLLSEALRGAGATLVDADGRRFMADLDPAGELAPRDVVARAVFSRQALLDLRPIGASLTERFPNATAACRRAGLDPLREPVPVTAAAHFAMGGVSTALDGRTSLRGLYACGETAWTGLHGANRLASNSLLEAAVLGHTLGRELRTGAAPSGPMRLPARDTRTSIASDVDGERRRVQETMWRGVGVERDHDGLVTAIGELDAIASRHETAAVASREEGELRNLALVAALVARAALERTESRGGHYRSDHPEPNEAWRRHQWIHVAPGAGGVAERIHVGSTSPLAAKGA